MSQESQHATNSHDSVSQPINGSDNIFSINEYSGYNQRDTEKKLDPVSERLFEIAGNIARARYDHLAENFFTEKEINRSNFAVDVAKTIFGRVLSVQRMVPLTEDILKDTESEKVGALIFGPLGQNEKVRNFWFDGIYGGFAHWYFNQEVNDPNTKTIQSVTLHYEVRMKDILRVSSNPATPNGLIHGKEKTDFVTATELYHDRVLDQIYKINNNADSTDDRLAG